MTTLVATVGANPLPVAIAVHRLQPERLELLVTGMSQDVGQRLRTFARKHLKAGAEVNLHVVDPHNYLRIAKTCTDLAADLPAWDLAYAGGTKVMSAAAEQVWAEQVWAANVPSETAWYVDGLNDVLYGHNHDGNDVELLEVRPPAEVTVRAFAALHGTTVTTEDRPPAERQTDIDLLCKSGLQPVYLNKINGQGMKALAVVRDLRLYLIGWPRPPRRTEGPMACFKEEAFKLRLLSAAVGGSLARTAVVAHPDLDTTQLSQLRSDLGVNYDRQQDGSVGPRTVILDTAPDTDSPQPDLVQAWLQR